MMDCLIPPISNLRVFFGVAVEAKYEEINRGQYEI